MTRSGVAILGYDPVAYHTQGEPTPGDPGFSAEWLHATWYFATTEHRDMFAENPDKYVPAFGGFCSFAIAQGVKVPVDPAAWTVHDGRLYLNESLLIRKAWRKDVDYYIEIGGRWWQEIKYK